MSDQSLAREAHRPRAAASPRLRCHSYWPGHNLDSDRARTAPQGSGRVGTLMTDGDEIYLVTDDDAFTLQSHQPELLLKLAERYSYLEWELAAGLLLPANREGLATFPAASVAVDQTLSPCSA